jgi:hypothetical protein
VLAGMNKKLLESLRMLLHRFNDWRHFHEIGARADHTDDS